MKIPNYEVFNGKELSAYKEVGGQRFEIMELSEIRLDPIIEKQQIKILNSKTPQYKTSYKGLDGSAKIKSITIKGKEIIDDTYENLRFVLYKDSITLNCCIEDIEDIVECEYINFTAE